MDYEDRITIATPEGVDLEVALGGLGSRFTAGLIDFLLESLLVGAALAAFFGLGELIGFNDSLTDALGAAVASALVFLALFAYHVLFETRANGRSPGKRAAGLRVVRAGGQPVGFRVSSVRNIVRALEGPPTLYFPAVMAILLTRRNQRLGDLAAGTLVVREARTRAEASPGSPPPAAPVGWDVSGVGAEQVATVRQFLERRHSLASEPRARLAGDLADRLRPRVAGADAGLDAERFLEQLAAAKAARL